MSAEAAWFVAGLAVGLALVPVVRVLSRKLGWELVPLGHWISDRQPWPTQTPREAQRVADAQALATASTEGVGPPGWMPGLDRRVLEGPEYEAAAAAQVGAGLAETSPLVRVIGVGETRVVDHVVIELLSLELREAGGTGSLRIRRPRSDRPYPHVAQFGPFMKPPTGDFSIPQPELALTDDLSTPYHVLPAGGGGHDHSWKCEFRFVPAPPREARALTVTVHRLTRDFPISPPPSPRTEDDLVGPWSFDVRLS